MTYQEARAEHYHQLRTNQAYRNAERLADLEVEQEPAHYIPPADKPEDDSRIDDLEERLLFLRPATGQSIYELKHLINKLTERVNQLTAKPSKKGRYDNYTI